MRDRVPLLLAGSALTLAVFACGTAADSGGTTSAVSASSGASSTSSSSGAMLDRCTVITNSVKEAGFDDVVTVHCDAKNAYLAGDTYPSHDKMNGITGTNDQVPIPAPGHESPIPLAPAEGSGTPVVNDGALGVAVNGVPIYDYTSAGMNDPAAYDPKFDTTTTGQLDHCNGHSGRGDDYHYHAAPNCMIDAMKNKGPAAIIGWAFDGYPIYGDTNPDGSAIAAGALDDCNSQKDADFGHRYHTSALHPYILQCLVGQADPATFPRVAPLDKQGGGGKPPGTPPQGGVQNLVFTEAQDGSRSMSYTYQGQDYSIHYKPSASAGCWDFEEKSWTTGGVVEQATYCRKP